MNRIISLCLFALIALNGNSAFSKSKEQKLQFIIYSDTSLIPEHFDPKHYDLISDSVVSNKVIYVHLLYLKRGSLDSIYFKNGIVCKNPIKNRIAAEISYSVSNKFISNFHNHRMVDFCFSSVFLHVRYSENIYLRFYLNPEIESTIAESCIDKNVFRLLVFRSIYYRGNKCREKKYKDIVKVIEKGKSIESVRYILADRQY